jgi:hypothetical protein
MRKTKKHSGLSKGEKRMAVKMALLDLSIIGMIAGVIGFFVITFIL